MKPSEGYRQARVRNPGKLHQGLDGIAHQVAGWLRRNAMPASKLLGEAQQICDAAERLRGLDDVELDDMIGHVRANFRRSRHSDVVACDEALGVIIEAASRSLGLRPFPVQVLGGLALFRGNLVEMQTGEGKTLTAAIAAVLFGWSGRSCHVVTVNDYLAKRDRTSLQPLYDRCGLTSGYISSSMQRAQRCLNYRTSIVYVTSKELAGDFLKDRLAMGAITDPSRRHLQSRFNGDACGDLMLDGLHVAIVDEADSVLVDDAVSSLIISRPAENKPFVEACKAAVRIASRLEQTVDYLVFSKEKEIRLTAKGVEHMTTLLEELPVFWRSMARAKEIILQALVAREFFHKDSHYVLQDDKVIIVDEFTGRLMPGRKWRNGIQQIIEIMEDVDVSAPDAVAARVSFQKFFRLFDKLCGMTGTVAGVDKELWRIYELASIVVPTNKPSRRTLLDRPVFLKRELKEAAVIREIMKYHHAGRPVLVGTRSVEGSQRLAVLLENEGVIFNLLNAVYHEQEAEIIARAGVRGAITIATNMAGRGTDIKLGPGVSELGGLHVVLVEPHEAGRIDRQFFGRCARQGDPGSVRVFVSIEDELLQRFIPSWGRAVLLRLASFHTGLTNRLVWSAVALSQVTAQSQAFRNRVAVLKKDDWVDESLSFSGSGLKL